MVSYTMVHQKLFILWSINKVMSKEWYKVYGWKHNPFTVRADSNIFGLEREKKLLLDFIVSGDICFITGNTGTGKTSLLKWLQSSVKDHKVIYLDSTALNEFFNLGSYLKDSRNLFEILFYDYPRDVVLLVDEAHLSQRELKDALKLYWDNSHVKSLVIAQIAKPTNFSKVFRARAGARMIKLSGLNSNMAKSIILSRTNNKLPFEDDVIEYLLKLSSNNPRKFLENCERITIDLADKWKGKKFNKSDIIPILTTKLKKGK